jgi:hypothetical protein
MSPVDINRLCTWLISYRDMVLPSPTSRSDRDMLADIGNALDGYAKLTRAVEALKDEHDIVDVGAPGEHPDQGPNWAMQATTFIDEEVRRPA